MIDFYKSDSTTKNYLDKYELLKYAKASVGYGTLTQEVAREAISKNELVIINQKQVYEDQQALAWYPRKGMPLYLKKIIEAVGK